MRQGADGTMATRHGGLLPCAVPLLLALGGGAALAQDTPARELSLDIGTEQLTGGRGQWQSQQLEGVWRATPQTTWVGQALRTKRNAGQRDTQFGLGAYQRLDSPWTVSGWLAYSETARVLPRWDARVQAQRGVGQASQLGVIAQRRGYEGTPATGGSVGVSSVSLLAEHYWGSYRAAWVGGVSRLDGGGQAFAQRIQLDRYYGGGSRISAVLSNGREIERAEPGPGGVIGAPLRLQVRSAAVFGTHWLAPQASDWGINWELSTVRTRLPNGSSYDRNGVRLGLRHRF